MNVLFVCRANVGRSQAAAEFYNQIVPGKGASAGTIVNNDGGKVGAQRGAANIINVMKEHDVDISNNIRTQVTEDIVNDYDKVVVMTEPETIPDWLRANQKTEIWTITDAKDQNIEKTREIAAAIKIKVQELADRPIPRQVTKD
jgi:protein-tyrosine-phosphatase